ncbi:MAG: large repetitive protein, partial [bacterium]
MHFTVRGRMAVIVSVLVGCAVASAPSGAQAPSAGAQISSKPGSAPARQPQSIGAAVRSGKVDGLTGARVSGADSATALVTVRNADTLRAPSQGKATPRSLADAGRVYAGRKAAVLDAAGSAVTKLRDYNLLPVILVRIDGADALRRLAASDEVVSIQADRRNEHELDQSLPLIHQPQVAAAGQTADGTAVAVLDTGVDFHAAAFGSCANAGDAGCSVAYAHDFPADDGQPDDDGHGTNVAGIVVGVAPATKILALDVFAADGSAADSDVLAAINWAIANQAAYHIKAMNLSLGAGDHHTAECSESAYSAPFQLARGAGILPVVAAGNSAYPEAGYVDGVGAPACATGAVRVGAVYDSDVGSYASGTSHCTDSTTAADKIACFSQSGGLLSLLAPGAKITAAGSTESGTSQAAPHVAGAAAVLGAVSPRASALKIERSLTVSGPTIHDSRSGVNRHRLDLADAVDGVQDADAVVDSAGCTDTTLPANDDGSTGSVALPFALNFFGTQYGQAFVNNNGNVTFSQPLGVFTPFTITASVPPIIAPFFADVDTRGAGSAQVRYGTTTYGGRPAFCVEWVDVGYFSGHADKTNSFQLLLVDRSSVGAGDFDMIMNYDRATWETGDASGGSAGYGGTPAGAGYSAGDGDPAHFYEFPGSRTHDGLLDVDPSGLVNGSRGSQQHGRYIFPIRNGLAPGNATIAGDVTGPNGIAVADAPMQACAHGGQCVTTRTGSGGHYSLSALAPGSYDVRAFPPAGSSLLAASALGVELTNGATTSASFSLDGPSGPPAGTTITDRGTTPDGIPVINWQDPLTLATTTCAGGSVSYQITLDGSVIRSGTMSESPAGSGHQTASVPALYPNHGNAVVTITSMSCPTASDDATIEFNVYIDPSGTVRDTHGHPVRGAMVTLLRADSADGPFTVVPDESAEMSPSNRSNPDVSHADGTFGWDVIAGFYQVRASRAGCVSATDPAIPFAETAVLEIPPPVTNLELVLDCPNFALSLAAAGSGTGSVTSGSAGIDCPTACSQSYLDDTVVTLTAAAASGSRFMGWGGACSGTQATCDVTMAQARSVTATFKALRALTVTTSGSGSGALTSSPAGIGCPTACSQSYLDDTVVTLTAAPAGGSRFTGWGGACSGTQATCDVTMSQARSVTATFQALRALTVARSGSGAGAVRSDPAGIACGATCAASYLDASVVTLTATPATGSRLSRWGGACSGTKPTCAVTMSEARSVTAAFDKVAAPGRTCLVPRLRNKRLAAARRAIVAAGCRSGKVRRVASRAVAKGRVIRQTPGAGRRVARGTSV